MELRMKESYSEVLARHAGPKPYAVTVTSWKSDDFIVPPTRANKAATAVAESVEERRSSKGSVAELPPMFRTLSRIKHHSERRHDGHGMVTAFCAATV